MVVGRGKGGTDTGRTLNQLSTSNHWHSALFLFLSTPFTPSALGLTLCQQRSFNESTSVLDLVSQFPLFIEPWIHRCLFYAAKQPLPHIAHKQPPASFQVSDTQSSLTQPRSDELRISRPSVFVWTVLPQSLSYPSRRLPIKPALLFIIVSWSLTLTWRRAKHSPSRWLS